MDDELDSSLPKTPKEALAVGSRFYFSGVPCVNGHLAKRKVNARYCPLCQTQHALKHRRKDPERMRQYWAERRKARREQISEYGKRRRAEDRERDFAVRDRYRRANLDKDAAKTMRRKAAKLKAIPPWCDLGEIARIYAEAARITAETGVPHEVDHIHPLQGKMICGLHVHTNMQILTKTENSRKKNLFNADAALAE